MDNKKENNSSLKDVMCFEDECSIYDKTKMQDYYSVVSKEDNVDLLNFNNQFTKILRENNSEFDKFLETVFIYNNLIRINQFTSDDYAKYPYFQEISDVAENYNNPKIEVYIDNLDNIIYELGSIIGFDNLDVSNMSVNHFKNIQFCETNSNDEKFENFLELSDYYGEQKKCLLEQENAEYNK